MLTVVMTGGSGFLAAHLIWHLQEHCPHAIGEIRTIDRKPFHHILDFTENIPMVHHRFELTDVRRLTKAIKDAHVIFHLARKRFDFKFAVNQNAIDRLYVRDNLIATECLIKAMIETAVPNLIYVGDAYANLPPKDNFGVSEMIHNGETTSYLLGVYGQSRTQAEVHARSFNGHVLSDGNRLQCICLRPTFIYGEGDRHLIDALHELALIGGDCVPHYTGSSNGMHQYIYAGTLAKTAVATMRCLLEDQRWCAGEFFYCMDETHCTKFSQFFSPIIQALGYRTANLTRPTITTTTTAATETKSSQLQNDKNLTKNGYYSSYIVDYLKTVAREMLATQLWRLSWGDAPPPSGISSYSLRFFYGLAFGFSDRKQRLLLARGAGFDGAAAEICAAETKAQVARHLAKTAKWAQQLQLNASDLDCRKDVATVTANMSSAINPLNLPFRMIPDDKY